MEKQVSAVPTPTVPDVKDEEEMSVEMGGEDGVPAQAHINNEVHPMNNPVVLTLMFELCPAKILNTFRLVSKQWYQLSLQSWRSTFTIKFRRYHFADGENENIFFNTDITGITADSHASLQVQKLLDYVKDPANDHSSKPFRKFKLDGWEIRELDAQMEEFSQLCGPFITDLELSQCIFHDLKSFRDYLFKWFPNLKKLSIRNAEFRSIRGSVTPSKEPQKVMEPLHGAHKGLKNLIIDLNHDQLPISWMEIFSHFPNLEALKLYDAYVTEYLEPMLNAIKIIRNHDPSNLQIKHLDILAGFVDPQYNMTPKTCLLIRDVKLPLETLNINFGVNTETEGVQDILEWHATTLIKLKAYRGPASLPYQNFTVGVQLDNLQELVMSDRLSESLTFMKYTPNLKKLHIYDDVYYDNRPPSITFIVENSDPRIMKDIKLEKCTDFRLDFVIFLNAARILMESLPNIEKVRMPMSAGQFQLACELWPKLRDLEVQRSMLDDEVITGLSPEDVKAINSAEEKGCRSGDDPSVGLVAIHIHPNITDLKHLRRFKMNDRNELSTKLKDCSAFYGFMKLPNLQRLHISASNKISERAKSALLAKIPDCTLARGRQYEDDSDSDY